LLLGLAFLIVFGLGFHFIYLDFQESSAGTAMAEQERFILGFLTLAGLYVTNFLIVMLSVLISVGAISGEIDSHTIDALVTKPIRRWELVLGKWLGYALMIAAGVLILPGGILLWVFLRSGFLLENIPAGLAFMYLEGLIIMTVSIAGGTRLSTLANGALAFMLYGLAFIGGWVEQIGAMLRNETAVDVGILASLLMPGEIMWRKASVLFQPTSVGPLDQFGPFAVAAQPSDLMVLYALAYVAVVLFFGLRSFSQRDL
jgi:ABC-type transport system involved in multi-copper enzyme maturation permease subunit